MATVYRLCLLSLLLIHTYLCAPIDKQDEGEQVKTAVHWLEKYGYIDASQGHVQDLQTAIEKMQKYARLPVTGELDEATLAKMAEPRCGHPDFATGSEESRVKRFALAPGRYPPGATIDVSYVNYTADMSVEEQERVMQDVINEWNSAADVKLQFHHNGEDADSAEIRVHNTVYDYDGTPFEPRGTLAYAYFPPHGDMYFDDSENWSEFQKDQSTISYKAVALHELGHSIGLDHSNVFNAVMYAYYAPDRYYLREDDKAGARAIYGPPVVKSSTSSTADVEEKTTLN